MTHTWIVGVDASEGSAHALEWAVAQAGQHDATVHAVAAFHLPVRELAALTRSTLVEILQGSKESVAGETREMIERLGQPPDVRVESVIVEGSASSVLLDSAQDAELVVVGSRGRGGFLGLRLGSVSHQVATHAKVPTVVVPQTAVVGEVSTVVVGMDHSDNAKQALAWVISFAPPTATVRAVGTWEPSPLATEADLLNYPERSELFFERCEEAVDEVLGSSHARTVERDFGVGIPRQALHDASAGAELLVVGARGHGAIGSAVLGSVSSWLVANATCATAVVPGS